jgi:hypothetical protein
MLCFNVPFLSRCAGFVPLFRTTLRCIFVPGRIASEGAPTVSNLQFFEEVPHVRRHAVYGFRRVHSTEYIRTRLIALDFILRNQGFTYLGSEEQKLSFFCGQLGIDKKILCGSPEPQPTEKSIT